MEFKLPPSAYVNKFIPKSKFYERAALSTKLQNEFVKKIQRITWKYKLAESTVGISKTESVEEIQIFEIELKEMVIPKKVLTVIDKAIPYQILYKFIHEENTAYAITLKDKSSLQNYYFSEWNDELEFEFTGTSLEAVYQKLIKAFIPDEAKTEKSFDDVVAKDAKIKTLENDITKLESKIKREKQFNRKVELNKTLLNKKKELKEIKRID